MNYTEKDFSAFPFNPLKNTDLHKAVGFIPDALTVTTKYLDVEVVKTHAKIHNLLAYTMLMYDSRSVLIPRERDIDTRKRIAADLAGLEHSDDYFTLTHEVLMTLVVWYLKTQVKSREFAAIVALEYKFWENITELMSPIVGDTNKERLEAAQKKAVISSEIDNDINKLNRYYKDFFGDDDAIATTVKKQSFRPERFMQSK